MKANSICITKPDDFHCHLRRPVIEVAVKHTASQFCRAVAMGNTVPAIAIGEDAEKYKQEILSAVPAGTDFEPIMTIMLTKKTTPEIVTEAARCGVRVLKYIPEGVSTNSDESVPLDRLVDFYPVLETLRDLGMIFSVHWELMFDKGRVIPETCREEAAIPHLCQTVKDFPGLRIIAEHATTKTMIKYIKQAPKNVAATLTVHHALLTCQDVYDRHGEIYKPFNYCKPVAKRYDDREAVLSAMLSGDPHFFFGSDSAPHPLSAKEKCPPAAGIFSAPVALALLTYIFVGFCVKDRLEDFTSKFGADFYDLPRNTKTIELKREKWRVPDEYFGIVPFMAGQVLNWQVV